jgi:surface protein
MTLKEYYDFPEGTNCTRRYYSFVDEYDDYPVEGDLSNMFYKQSARRYIKKLTNIKPTKTEYMFCGCTGLQSINNLSEFDMSECTSTSCMFSGCTYLQNPSGIENWDTSKVTDMSYMFYGCTNITSFIVNWDTSKVTTMHSMFGDSSSFNMTTLCALDCSSISGNYYPLYNAPRMTNVGGFLNMKSSWTNAFGLARCSGLTYESCINILNGLYDFTGNGVTPSSTQGKLKVHANFLTTVGDEISIGTSKGWTITT